MRKKVKPKKVQNRGRSVKYTHKVYRSEKICMCMWTSATICLQRMHSEAEIRRFQCDVQWMRVLYWASTQRTA